MNLSAYFDNSTSTWKPMGSGVWGTMGWTHELFSVAIHPHTHGL